MSEKRGAIEAAGTQLAFVYQGSEDRAAKLFEQYGLTGISRFRDPEAVLYQAFELSQAKTGQMLGLKVMRRGLEALFRGHRVGGMNEANSQLPGVFLLYRSRILKSYRHRTIADRPDYEAAAICEL